VHRTSEPRVNPKLGHRAARQANLFPKNSLCPLASLAKDFLPEIFMSLLHQPKELT